MKKEVFLGKIAAARKEILDAEADLASVLQQLQSGRRAEKKTIGKALEDAFVKLRAAREALVDLETAAQDE